jgi:hypothetical protein
MHRRCRGSRISHSTARLLWAEASLGGSLGRLPSSFCNACAAWPPLYNNKKNPQSRRASSLQLSLHIKNKIFLGKKLVRYAAINKRNTARCVMPRLLRAARQRTVWAGRGPHPAPRLELSFQKTAAIFRGRKVIYHLLVFLPYPHHLTT